MSRAPISRRVGRVLTRQQARFEAGTGERWIPLLWGLALSVCLAWLARSRLYALDADELLAGYAQGVWLVGNGYRPEATLFRGIHMLEINWAFVLYPIALLQRWFNVTSLLVVVQAIALGSAVVPIAFLARRVAMLRLGATTVILAAYALHPATHQLALDGFHPSSLAVPSICAMAYFSATRSWKWYWLCIAFTLLCRADLGFAIALWGFVVLGAGDRRRGLATMVIGSIWALGLLLVVQPLAGEAVIAAGQYGTYGDSLGEALVRIITQPLDFIGDLVRRENATVIAGLLAPVLFLPLLTPRYLLPAMPLTALYMVVEGSPAAAATSPNAVFLAFMMVSLVYAMGRLGVVGVDRVFVDGGLLAALGAGSFLLYLVFSPASLYERPWDWRQRDGTDRAVLRAVAELDGDTAVRASPSALTELAGRRFVRALPTDQTPSLAVFNSDAQAVLVVEREIPEQTPAQRTAFDEQMRLFGYELVMDDSTNGVWLYFRP